MSLNYGSLFETWEVTLTKKIVAKFRYEWRCLRQDDAEDLIDECLIHWLTAKQKINPSEDKNLKAYLSVVLKNKLQDLAAEREAYKRRPYFRSVSLEELLESNPDSPFLADPRPSEPDPELRSKLESVIKKLTPNQKKICEALQSGETSITELSIKLAIRRNNVYKGILRIRQLFEQEGLKEYL